MQQDRDLKDLEVDSSSDSTVALAEIFSSFACFLELPCFFLFKAFLAFLR